MQAESERAAFMPDSRVVAKHTAHECPGCGYAYREFDSHPAQGFTPGTRWEQIPPTWSCPDCAVRDKTDFQTAAA